MTNRPERAEEARWLLEPPGPGEVHVHVAVGDDARLTPELREALDRVLSLLQTQDVSGFNIDLGSCTTVSCRLDTCQPVTLKPYATDFRCRIVEMCARLR
jgi:hypothetical protein